MTREEEVVYAILDLMKGGATLDTRAIITATMGKGYTKDEVLEGLVTCVEKGFIDLGGPGLPGQHLN